MTPLLSRRDFAARFTQAALVLTAAASLLPITSMAQDATPPAGFTALFNGKDLTGWRGGDTFDHRKLLAMPEAERTAKLAEWTKSMKEHWRAENGELINDG